MTSERTDRVAAEDGEFDVFLWLPDEARRPAPALLVIQEIYGVGPYVRAVASDLAERGYVAAAPDLFWRLQRGWAAEHDQSGLQRSMELAQRFDRDLGVQDCLATLEHVRRVPEASGALGAIGFCLGGTLAFMVAAAAKLDVAVSYYGSGVPDNLDRLADIRCPLQLQFGGSDPFIPRDAVARVEIAVEPLEHVELHVHEGAGHAFHNRFAPKFHNAVAADDAWQRTLRFLDAHIPPRTAETRV